MNFHFRDGEKNQERIKIFFGEEMNFENVWTFYHSEQSVFEVNKKVNKIGRVDVNLSSLIL